MVWKTPGIHFSRELRSMISDRLMTQSQYFVDHFPGRIIAVT
jgi:hypothetical protein